MAEKPPMVNLPCDELDPDKAIVQSQDLEHVADPITRVSNKGVKIKPVDAGDEARTEEDAAAALKQLEDSVKGGTYN